MARIVDAAEHEMETLQGLVDFEGKHVLDIGCGEGRTAWRIARTAASVIGVDPDPARIASARVTAVDETACKPRFLAEDIVSLEIAAGTFDIAIFTRSL
jgi:ubiquinone/menaquinone biosynthesis C-methylase UbiE